VRQILSVADRERERESERARERESERARERERERERESVCVCVCVCVSATDRIYRIRKRERGGELGHHISTQRYIHTLSHTHTLPALTCQLSLYPHTPAPHSLVTHTHTHTHTHTTRTDLSTFTLPLHTSPHKRTCTHSAVFRISDLMCIMSIFFANCVENGCDF